MKQATITLQGMHCASCGDHITKQLQALEGIKQVKVDAVKQVCTLTCADPVKEVDLRLAVKKAGYLATSVAFSR